jgi:Fe-S oxidoreductase
MQDVPFERALRERTTEMLDACTLCGKCVQVCPSAEPAGIAASAPGEVMAGVIDILQSGSGTPASARWAGSCILSGACIAACDVGVNPRFLLGMARLAIAGAAQALPERRRRAVTSFRTLARDVSVLSRLQLTDVVLKRLGQGSDADAGREASEGAPDFVFYTGCNVLKTPHIALLALDIMDALGMRYRVMGGPTHCCGIVHMRAGDAQVSGRMATGTLDKLAASGSAQVLSWCPSCHVQFTETTLPAIERQRGARPFEMTPFIRYLSSRLGDLKPLLRGRAELRVALHRHPGVTGVVEAAEAILRAVPGVELVDLGQPAVGLQSANLSVLPAHKRELQLRELEAARQAEVDALAVVYHSDYRELCAHERDWPFRIVNLLEIVADSMGLHQDDTYKQLKIRQDVDAILADCHDLLDQHGLEEATARDVILTAMLGDQPLALLGSRAARPTAS